VRRPLWTYLQFAGTWAGGTPVFWFYCGHKQGPRYLLSDMDTLTAQEVGQELGGN